MRNYLETGSLSHIIGYVGDITKDELKLMYNQGYKSGDVIGKAGIEKQYDMTLRGRDGREYRTVDVKGKSIASEQEIVDPPVMGSNIVLTIDSTIQKLAEKALGQRMGSVDRPEAGDRRDPGDGFLSLVQPESLRGRRRGGRIRQAPRRSEQPAL